MHKLYELKEKLIDELEDYSENGKFSKEDVESIKYMASAVDHLCNIMEEKEEYSGAYMDDMGMRSYARGRGRNAKRDSMGRYSSRNYSMAKNDMVMELRDLMEDAPDSQTRSEIERLVTRLEKM